MLTGTPIRSDEKATAWLAYDDAGAIDHPEEGTYTLTYGEAVDLGYCRPATFHRHEGRFTVDLEGGEHIVVTSKQPAQLTPELIEIPGLQAALNFYKLALKPQFEADNKTPRVDGYQGTMVEWASDKPRAGAVLFSGSAKLGTRRSCWPVFESTSGHADGGAVGPPTSHAGRAAYKVFAFFSGSPASGDAGRADPPRASTVPRRLSNRPGERARVIAAVDHDLAVDDDGGDADRVAVRVGVRRAVGDQHRVEHGHVRPRPRPQQASIREAERPRGGAGHLGDRLLERQQPEIADAGAQDARMGAVVARMGLALAGDAGGGERVAVRAHRHPRRARDRVHVGAAIDVIRMRVSPRSATR